MASLSWVDWLVFWITIVISASIGIVFSLTGGKQKTSKEYLMADRKMGLLPVALSLIVSNVSALMILGFTAEVYEYGVQLIMFTVTAVPMVFITAFLFVPFIRELEMVSCYEYLERRFHSKAVRLIGSFLGITAAAFYVGTASYAPSLAVEAVSGFPLWGSIVLTIGVSTFYTTLGGMKAVLWSDSFQFVIMLVGLLAVMIRGFMEIGGFVPMWNKLGEGQRLNFFVFDPSPTTRHTFWSIVCSSCFRYVIMNAFSQASVQRIAAVESTKKAQKALMTKAPLMLLLSLPSALLGMIVYAYYATKSCDPVQMKYVRSTNHLLPYFVSEVMFDIPGLSGLFMAVLFSGCLSSNSTSLNGIAANVWEDFLKHRIKYKKDWVPAFINKVTVVVFGVIGIGVAFLCEQIKGPVIQIFITLNATIMGPQVGLFIMGCLLPWTNAKGAMVGAFVAAAVNAWIVIGKSVLDVKSYVPYIPPVSISGCPAVNASANFSVFSTEWTPFAQTVTTNILSNVTISDYISESNYELHGIEYFYAISYKLYGFLGILVSVVVGVIVSCMTGPNKPGDLDPKLVLPIIRKLGWKEKDNVSDQGVELAKAKEAEADREIANHAYDEKE